MPRMSSTSSITGTGFMKWKPMNRSGRSVPEASRVIEIDEVFEVRMVCGARWGTSALKILVLQRLLLGRRLDDEVARPERRQDALELDAPECCVAVGFGDLAAVDLAVHVAADDLGRAGERLLGDVVQDHVEARQREDMGDAVAHLSSADDTDALDFLHSPPLFDRPRPP